MIGVHPPGSDLGAIHKAAKDFKLDCPIVIDVRTPDDSKSWGTFFEAYGVDRVPNAVLIDQQGKIRGTGELSGLVKRAEELAGKPR